MLKGLYQRSKSCNCLLELTSHNAKAFPRSTRSQLPSCTSRLERLGFIAFSFTSRLVFFRGLYFQEKSCTNFFHLCVEGFSVKGALIQAEKSAVLVDGASMAADYSSIGTEHQNILKQQRLKGVGL